MSVFRVPTMHSTSSFRFEPVLNLNRTLYEPNPGSGSVRFGGSDFLAKTRTGPDIGNTQTVGRVVWGLEAVFWARTGGGVLDRSPSDVLGGCAGAAARVARPLPREPLAAAAARVRFAGGGELGAAVVLLSSSAVKSMEFPLLSLTDAPLLVGGIFIAGGRIITYTEWLPNGTLSPVCVWASTASDLKGCRPLSDLDRRTAGSLSAGRLHGRRRSGRRLSNLDRCEAVAGCILMQGGGGHATGRCCCSSRRCCWEIACFSVLNFQTVVHDLTAADRKVEVVGGRGGNKRRLWAQGSLRTWWGRGEVVGIKVIQTNSRSRALHKGDLRGHEPVERDTNQPMCELTWPPIPSSAQMGRHSSGPAILLTPLVLLLVITSLNSRGMGAICQPVLVKRPQLLLTRGAKIQAHNFCVP
ncbi:hypothetical protein B0H16DRAFT_1473481 [Mycena metata]|uniref:Uncharacterized protein n=1 Tax=Mycena metata TaxID=1033252 RepID=A0AAD7MLI2_9AGAR|nr:hypothetical protein B0H16DRAFT_1473481 [Mycena metata]